MVFVPMLKKRKIMNTVLKPTRKKSSLSGKAKTNNSNRRAKHREKQYSLHQLLHPDYILFDWEFYSRELDFE